MMPAEPLEPAFAEPIVVEPDASIEEAALIMAEKKIGCLPVIDGDELLELFEDRFATTDDLVVSIVGDVDVDDTRDLAARYFGTLPGGDDDTDMPDDGDDGRRITVPD